MEVIALVVIVVIVVAIILALGNTNSSSGDDSEAETTSYQNNNSGGNGQQYHRQTHEVQETQEVRQNMPTQWIFTDDNDRYYLAISLTDGSYCGPITLAELRAFQLMPDYMVTTERLDGNWYPAGNFFCLADLFYENMPNMNLEEGSDFKINDDGTITRLEKRKDDEDFKINDDGTITRKKKRR